MFGELTDPLEREQHARAEAALDDLVEAEGAGAAWRAWRRLEQAWEPVHPDARRALKARARTRLPHVDDGARRLAVVEKLPDG